MNTRIAITISAAVLSLAFAGGCRKQEEPSSTKTTSANPPTVDTSRSATDRPTAAPAAATLASEDKEFMTKAAQGGMLEVTLGSSAAQRAASADVKTFANRMVTDHGKANNELKQLAARKGATLPTELDKDHKDKIASLTKHTGAKFDKAYIDEMVDDHEKDVKEFRDAAKDAKDPDLRAWAQKTLPVLEEHLNMAKDLKNKTHERT